MSTSSRTHDALKATDHVSHLSGLGTNVRVEAHDQGESAPELGPVVGKAGQGRYGVGMTSSDTRYSVKSWTSLTSSFAVLLARVWASIAEDTNCRLSEEVDGLPEPN